jgi:hypothetical protein
MAGNDEREGVGAAGLADGARRVVQRLGQFAVGARLVVGIAEICSQTRRWNGSGRAQAAAKDENPASAR